MSRLTPEEREALDAVERSLDLMEPNNALLFREGGQKIADALRRMLPDLDDVTLGRVLRATSTVIAAKDVTDDVRIALAMLTAAAVELTSLERGSGESQQ